MIGFFLNMNLFVAILCESFFMEKDEPTDGDRASSPVLPFTPDLPNGAARPPGLGGSGGAVPDDADMALFCLPPRNPLRHLSLRVVHSSLFDGGIITLIIFSSLCLAVDSPRLDAASDAAALLNHLNTITTCLFIGEATLKSIAFGFVFTPHACVPHRHLHLRLCLPHLTPTPPRHLLLLLHLFLPISNLSANAPVRYRPPERRGCQPSHPPPPTTPPTWPLTPTLNTRELISPL